MDEATFIKRPKIPNGHRRAPWHDYYDRSIYLITVNASYGMPLLSTIQGSSGSHDYPPVAVNTALGNVVGECMSDLKRTFPFVKILRRVIMPEHLHFVLFVTQKTNTHLGEIVSAMKSECTRRFSGMNLIGPDRRQSVFESGYHDRILLKEGQLDRMLKYVSDNPRRRLIRMQNPGFFGRYGIGMFEGVEYEAYGNIGLLDDPDIEAVKVSSKYSEEELLWRKRVWKRTVENCGVLVSPFVSKSEKLVRDWAVQNGGRLICMLDNGFGDCYTPKGWMHELCAEGRLLLIAPLHHETARVVRGKDYWERMNRFALAIAEGGNWQKLRF